MAKKEKSTVTENETERVIVEVSKNALFVAQQFADETKRKRKGVLELWIEDSAKNQTRKKQK